jgi:hypothetical protein
MMKKAYVALILVHLFAVALLAQEKKKPFEFSGYITSMQSAMFDTLFPKQ